MKSTAKAEALVRDLAERLKKRFPAKTVRQARDAQGWPMVFISASGSEAAGQEVQAIRIKAVDAVSKDVFGNDLVAFAPHTLEHAYELAAANNPIPTDADIYTVAWEASKLGVKTQLKEIANLTAVSEASMDATAAAVELDDINWPTKGV